MQCQYTRSLTLWAIGMLQSLETRFYEVPRCAEKEEGGLQCLPQVLELHQDNHFIESPQTVAIMLISL